MNARPWFKAYGSISATIDPDRYPSVNAMLEEAMTRYADHVAFHSLGGQLTYRQVDELSSAFCAYLQQRLGVHKGDRVAVMLPNFVAFPIAFLGIVRAGAIQVNVNPLYTPRELAHQLRDAGCKTIIIFNGATPTLAEVIGDTPVEQVITVTPGDGLDLDAPTPVVDTRLSSGIAFADALREGQTLERQPVHVTGDDGLFLQYTGGTTGLSKGATLSHRNLVANTEQFKALLPGIQLDGEDSVVTAIPLYHIFALMVNFICYFSVGAKNWLVANPRDLDGLIATLKEARPTAFTGVNTLFNGLTQHPGLKEVDWSRGRLCAGGGSAVLEVTSRRWQEITGLFIREGYGLSETSPIVSLNLVGVNEYSGTTGVPLPSTDVKLLNDEGNEVEPGQPGEVCVKGPQVMSGYWGHPKGDLASFTADGYFKTGDVGQFDGRGFLKIVDRKKDMIIVSGFNVYPNDVEAVATGVPGVLECACVGVPDDKTGEAVKLFVVRTQGVDVTEQAVIDGCRQNLTGYKVPKHVQFIASLPKSTVGKILRRELRTV
jgi:long-chain acyl-CoA synthetase